MEAFSQVLGHFARGTVSNLSRQIVCVAVHRHVGKLLSVQTRNHQINLLRPCSSTSTIYNTTTSDHQKLQQRAVYRTNINEPKYQSMEDQGLHYKIPDDVAKNILHEASPLEFQKQVQTLREASVIVRQPALEVINYIKHLNLDNPPVKFVFYGRRGSGRTMSLLHVMHYCHEDQWVLVHLPWPAFWTAYKVEKAKSPLDPERYDMPEKASEWLQLFKNQNQTVLKDVVTQFSYTWTKRESTSEGSPIMDLVDFGLLRPKFATDCVGALVKELKCQATQKKLKVMLAVDGVNAFWIKTNIFTDLRENIPADQISLIHYFKKLLLNDWTNGVVVTTVDPKAISREMETSENITPHYLIGDKGSPYMEPFIPVNVPNYSDKEVYSTLEYFQDMNWLQLPASWTDEGRKEIIFLSNKNPYQLIRLCAAR